MGGGKGEGHVSRRAIFFGLHLLPPLSPSPKRRAWETIWRERVLCGCHCRVRGASASQTGLWRFWKYTHCKRLGLPVDR